MEKPYLALLSAIDDFAVDSLIIDGPYKPKCMSTDAVPIQIDKPRASWTDEEKRLYSLNSRARNAIIQSIPPNVFNSMHALKHAKDLWDHLVRMFEGDEEVKRNSRDSRNKKYEDFVGADGESVTQIYCYFN